MLMRDKEHDLYLCFNISLWVLYFLRNTSNTLPHPLQSHDSEMTVPCVVSVAVLCELCLREYQHETVYCEEH